MSMLEPDDDDDAKSVESMDSFVRDAPQRRGSQDAYISPASRTSSSCQSDSRLGLLQDAAAALTTTTMPMNSTDQQQQQQQRRPSLTMSQQQGESPHHVRSNSDIATVASHTGSIPPTPAHDFFQNLGYEHDSDASAASLVFKDSMPMTAHGQSTTQLDNSNGGGIARNRLPSYDSVGSSNSFRLISPRSRPQQQRQRRPVTPTNVKPHLLPYSERRKLLQQRQKQRQQQQHGQSSSDRLQQQPPPTFQPYPVQGMPYPPPQQQASPHQQLPPYPGLAVPPYPMQPYPNPLGYPPPPPQPPPPPPPPAQQQHQHQQQHAFVPELSPQTPQAYPYQTQTIGGVTRQGNVPQRPSVPRPPARFANSPTANISRTESHDSVEDIDPGRASRSAARDAMLPPPPPPPLHAAPMYGPPFLVRQESAGSVSSLGSMDQSGREPPSAAQHYAEHIPLDMASPDYTATGNHNGNLMPLQDQNHEPSLARDRFPVMPTPSLPTKGDEYANMHDYNPTLKRPRTKQASRQRQQPRHSTQKSSRHGANIHGVSQLWISDEGSDSGTGPRRRRRGHGCLQSNHGVDGSSTNVSSSGVSDSESANEAGDQLPEPHEKTRLLPPPGASTSELMDRSYTEDHRRREQNSRRSAHRARGAQRQGRVDLADHIPESYDDNRYRSRRKHKTKKQKKKYTSRKLRGNDASDSSLTSNDSMSKDHWMGRRQRMLDIERARLIKQWKIEAVSENRRNDDSWCHRLCQVFEGAQDLPNRCNCLLLWCEPFIANLPMTVGAIALAIANLGVDWFKFAEEIDSHCMPVHFHSALQCSFPEFPGCYYCDAPTRLHQFASFFRQTCSVFAGLLTAAFIAKVFLFHRIVLDELSSPTTAAPAGFICAAMAVVFVGRGVLGMIIVSVASILHLCLAIWFIYMALAYRTLPEPSWFPNTVAIGICAIKTWLYFPSVGQFLMMISILLTFFFLPTSLIRVALNRKIKAPIAWMQMSAPNIILYAMTIMAQPSFLEEHPDVTSYQRLHRAVYLPCMHFLFGLVVAGMVASVAGLVVRWNEFRNTPFSSAHAAFCTPSLYHANAVQAYRAAVISFAGLSNSHPYLLFLYCYWVLALVFGTIVTAKVASRYLWCLAGWTHFDSVDNDIEPPAPYETAMTLSFLINTGDTLVQPFVSPAVLQANETGQLIFCRDIAGRKFFRRTREVTALGFEPIMNATEVELERELLTDFVGKNPPRPRHRTLSVPGIDFNYGTYLDTSSRIFDLESSTAQA